MSKRKPPLRRLFAGYSQMAPAQCPKCERTLRSVTGVASTADLTRPDPGSITMCDQCATWLVFTDTMALRLATREEIRSVPADLKRLATDLMLQMTMARRTH